jgi:2-polyprenyl-6-methoxyphenol hydroxylase-like FAD-dependent oxidoreductase
MNVQRETRKALIIGCGIAGPVTAMLLRRIGIDAAVYEAQPAPDDYAGLFLNLASNGLEVLRTLSLEGLVAAEGFASPRMEIWNGAGRRLGVVRNGAAEGGGPVSVVIKRGALHQILREAAVGAGVPIHFGKELTGVEVDADGAVSATFAEGSTATGDLLVGCDGIYSRTRQLIDPQAPRPSYTGLVSCGGFAHGVPLAPTPDTQHFIFGRRAFFGYLVRPSGEIYWFNNHAHPGAPRRSELERLPQAERRRLLLELHRDDQPFINAVIGATAGEIGMYPIYDLRSMPRWRSGPLVLLGDAAHATSPSAGQGAALALEDGLALARCVRDIPDLEAALAAYEGLRKARAERVVRYSRARGANKTAPGPVARWLRDLTLPFVLRHFASPRSLDWLYSYKLPWEEPAAVAAQT